MNDTDRELARRAAMHMSWVCVLAAVLSVAFFEWRDVPWSRAWQVKLAVAAMLLGVVIVVRGLPRWASLVVLSVEALLAMLAFWGTAAMQAAAGGLFTPFNPNKILALLVALLSPSVWLGAVVIGMTMLLPLLQYLLWSDAVRNQIPALEPAQTLAVGAAALVFLGARRRAAARREELAELVAEQAWLDHVAGLGMIVRDRLRAAVVAIRRALAALQGRHASIATLLVRMDGAVGRLATLTETLEPLAEHVGTGRSARRERLTARISCEEARRAALAFSAIAVVSGLITYLGASTVRGFPTLVLATVLAISISIVAVALPWSQLPAPVYRGLFVIQGLSVIVASLITNDALAHQGPIDAFPGIKLAVIVIAMLSPSARIGAALIVLAMIGPLLETYVWWSAQQRSSLSTLEPWWTVAFGVTALCLLAAQRRRAAIVDDLARARADRDGTVQVARLAVALRDGVNSSLQTLLMASEIAHASHADRELADIAALVGELRALLDTLPDLDARVVGDSVDLSFDPLASIAAEVHKVVAR